MKFQYLILLKKSKIKYYDSRIGGEGYNFIPIEGSLSTIGTFGIGPDGKIDPNGIWSKFNFFYPIDVAKLRIRYGLANDLWI